MVSEVDGRVRVQLASESREMLMRALKATQLELAAVRNQLQVLLLLTLGCCSHWVVVHIGVAHIGVFHIGDFHIGVFHIGVFHIGLFTLLWQIITGDCEGGRKGGQFNFGSQMDQHCMRVDEHSYLNLYGEDGKFRNLSDVQQADDPTVGAVGVSPLVSAVAQGSAVRPDAESQVVVVEAQSKTKFGAPKTDAVERSWQDKSEGLGHVSKERLKAEVKEQ